MSTKVWGYNPNTKEWDVPLPDPQDEFVFNAQTGRFEYRAYGLTIARDNCCGNWLLWKGKKKIAVAKSFDRAKQKARALIEDGVVAPLVQQQYNEGTASPAGSHQSAFDAEEAVTGSPPVENRR